MLTVYLAKKLTFARAGPLGLLVILPLAILWLQLPAHIHLSRGHSHQYRAQYAVSTG
jgi:hypothetical protein